MGFLGDLVVKDPAAMQEIWVRSLGQEVPLQEEMQPTPVFLPGEFHGHRSLVGYSPWGCKESVTTEQLSSSNNKCIQNSVIQKRDGKCGFPSTLPIPFPHQWKKKKKEIE